MPAVSGALTAPPLRIVDRTPALRSSHVTVTGLLSLNRNLLEALKEV
jgi:hypothetical protein